MAITAAEKKVDKASGLLVLVIAFCLPYIQLIMLFQLLRMKLIVSEEVDWMQWDGGKLYCNQKWIEKSSLTTVVKMLANSIIIQHI